MKAHRGRLVGRALTRLCLAALQVFAQRLLQPLLPCILVHRSDLAWPGARFNLSPYAARGLPLLRNNDVNHSRLPVFAITQIPHLEAKLPQPTPIVSRRRLTASRRGVAS